MVEEIVAGVTGQPHLGEHGEIAPGRIGLAQQGERALGIERAIGDPEFRGRGRDSVEVMGWHGESRLGLFEINCGHYIGGDGEWLIRNVVDTSFIKISPRPN